MSRVSDGKELQPLLLGSGCGCTRSARASADQGCKHKTQLPGLKGFFGTF